MSASTSRYTGISAWSLASARTSSRVRHRFDRVHVRDGVPGRGVLLPAARLDSELLGEHRDQDLYLHIPKAGQLVDPRGEIVPVGGLPPYRPGIASVFGDDHLAESLCALGHAARESVQRGPLAEHADELVRVHGGDLPHVEVP